MAHIYTAKYLIPGNAPPIAGGALLARQGRIIAVGPYRELQKNNPGAIRIDFGEALLLPLLINAHTHLELTHAPDWAAAIGETEAPVDFVDWILRLIRSKRKLQPEDYRTSLADGIERALATGTGAVGDICSQLGCCSEHRNSPLLGTLYLEGLGHDPALIIQRKQQINAILSEPQIGLLQPGLSPHSPYTISAAYLEDIYTKCRQQRLPCSTHLAESAAETDFIENGHGALASSFYPQVGWESLLPQARHCSPTVYLEGQGGLFPGNLLVHGVHLNPADIALLAKKRMHLALCPRSNAKLKVGKAPIVELLRAGVNLCLGTDSLASNDSLSVWDEMAFAARWFAGQLDAPQLFHMATLAGAEALGTGNQLGSLSRGKYCSFQVLEPSAMPGDHELFDYLAAPGRTNEIVQLYHQQQPHLSPPTEKFKL